MRKTLAFGLLFMLMLTATAGAAGKVTVDPNASGIAPKAADLTIDKRLEQKVTYESGYKRLSDVAKDLSAMTGVKINAGYNVKDWKIRDIPVVVCVKDLPLGKLLNAIVESTHTNLASDVLETPQAGKTTVYRIYRTHRIQEEIDKSLDTWHQKQLDRINWAWDAMLKLAKSPAQQQQMIAKEAAFGRIIVAESKILASLGLGTRENLMSGKTITLEAQASPQASLMKEIMMAHWERTNEDYKKSHNGKQLEQPSKEDSDALTLTIKLQDMGKSGGITDITMDLYPVPYENYKEHRLLSVGAFSQAFDGIKGLDLPARVNTDELGNPETEHPGNSSLRPLKTDDDWVNPAFQSKVTLPVPQNKSIPDISDELMELAKVTGLNIVSEDLQSHMCGWMIELNDVFDKKRVSADLLKQIGGSWFYDKDSNLLVGWTRQNGFWRVYHKDLAPADIIDTLASKFDKGIELDDLTPITTLTQGQRNFWINNDNKLMRFISAFPNNLPLWQLYDSLKPEDKALVKSNTGLSLAKLGPEAVCNSLKAGYSQTNLASFPRSDKKNDDSTSINSLLNPDTIGKIRMRLKQGPATVQTPPERNSKEGGCYLPLHHAWIMEFVMEKNGEESVVYSSDAGVSFPVYSSKRERELFNQLVK